MKKGFTLIEMLAIITLLSIILLVAVPSIVTTNKTSKETDYNEFTNTITEAAETYIEINSQDYIDLKQNNAATTIIQIDDLVAEGLLQGTMINPNTNKKLTEEQGTVTVINQDGVLKYTYNE